MDLVHDRGSMDPVHQSGPWIRSKEGVHGPLVHVLSSPKLNWSFAVFKYRFTYIHTCIHTGTTFSEFPFVSGIFQWDEPKKPLPFTSQQEFPGICGPICSLWTGLWSQTASGNVASMREPLDGRLWWYWIAASAAKKNGASFKNYHRLSHMFHLCGVQIRQSLLCNMRDWSQG